MKQWRQWSRLDLDLSPVAKVVNHTRHSSIFLLYHAHRGRFEMNIVNCMPGMWKFLGSYEPHLYTSTMDMTITSRIFERTSTSHHAEASCWYLRFDNCSSQMERAERYNHDDHKTTLKLQAQWMDEPQEESHRTVRHASRITIRLTSNKRSQRALVSLR